MKLREKGMGALIPIIIVGLVGVGALGYFIISGRSDDTDENKQESTQEQNGNGEAGIFNSIEPPMTMTVTTTDSANPASNGTFVYKIQDDKVWEAVSTIGDTKSTIVYDGKYTYLKGTGDKWTRVPSDESYAGAPSYDQYQLTEDDLTQLGTVGKITGDADCPTGTCKVYEMEIAGSIYKYYISEASQIVKMEYTLGTATYTVEFSGGDVKIEIPTEFTDINVPNTP